MSIASQTIEPPSPASPAGRTSSALTHRQLHGAILPTLLRMAAPNFAEALARVSFVTLDGVFVGWLGGDALAGLGLVMPFFFLVQIASAGGLGTGVAGAVARALGAGRRDEATKLVLHAFVLALLTGALVSVLMLGLGDVFYRAMAGGAGSAAALDKALTYGSVMFVGAPLILLANLLANAVRGTGHMRLPAFTIVGGEAMHLILSPLLILGWGPIPSLGMSGAALAALSPYLFGTVVLFLYLRAGRGVVRLSFARGQLSVARFWAILRVGLAASLTTVFNQAQALFLTAMIGGFGTAGIAAFAGAVRLELVQMPVVFALGTALVTMVGTNIGAGNGERARRIAWLGGLVGGAIGAIVAVVCLALPLSWMSLFTRDPGVADIGAQYLRAIGLSTVPFCVGLALYFAAQGAGQAWTVIVAMLIRAGVTIGGGWLAVGLLGGGLHALFLVTSAGAALMGVWMIAVVARTRWRV